MKTIALIHRVIPFLFTGSLCLAGDLSGTVKMVGVESADVDLKTDLVPAVGDKAEIYFKVPGSDQEIAVGTGSVSWVGLDVVKVKIEQASGTVTRNQLVRIHSAAPQKRKAGAPSIPPEMMPQRAPSGPSKLAESVAGKPSGSTEEQKQTEIRQQASKAGAEDPASELKKAGETPKEGEAKTAKDYYNEGFAKHKAGDRDAAVAAYTKAIEADPNYAPAYYNRACIYLVKRNYDGLINDATKALDLGHASRANLFCLRGTAWAKKSDYDKALADHNAAVEVDPAFAPAYSNRANDYYHKRDLTRAMSDCNKSIELDAASPLPWYNRGYINYSLRKNVNAVSDWQKAIELDPGYAAELEPLIKKLSGSR